MNPDDIPTEITELTYIEKKQLLAAKLPVLSQNQTAAFLARFWPAIEAHIREQVVTDLEDTREAYRVADLMRPKVERGGFLADWEWAVKVVRDGRPTV